MPRPRVSVVVPALNEQGNLAHVLPRIPALVDEVILVDGASTDETVAVARRLMPKIRVVQQRGAGKGAALRTGFRASTGDIIVTIDADGSTDPAEIPYFVHALLSGADVAKGSRFLHGGGTSDMPLHRRLGNGVFVHLVRRLYGGRYTDLCYGYNAFWRRSLEILDLDGDGFEIETMINIRVLRAGLRIFEVPSFESRRVWGDGRLRTIPDGWRVLKTIFRERRRPGRRYPPHYVRPEFVSDDASVSRTGWPWDMQDPGRDHVRRPLAVIEGRGDDTRATGIVAARSDRVSG
jgi:glycosyltransferase involved in cell wall biosynthesis